MPSPAAMLNKMVGSSASPYSTRKRARELDGVEESSSKRRAVNEGLMGNRSAEVQKAQTRRSKSRLSIPNKALLVASSDADPSKRRVRHSYELPVSPEQHNNKKKVKESEEPSRPKKSLRKVGQMKDKASTPFKGVSKFDHLQSDARLDSFDSPAKNTRLKRVEQEKLDKQNRKQKHTASKNPLERLKGQASQHTSTSGKAKPKSPFKAAAYETTKDTESYKISEASSSDDNSSEDVDAVGDNEPDDSGVRADNATVEDSEGEEHTDPNPRSSHTEQEHRTSNTKRPASRRSPTQRGTTTNSIATPEQDVHIEEEINQGQPALQAPPSRQEAERADAHVEGNAEPTDDSVDEDRQRSANGNDHAQHSEDSPVEDEAEEASQNQDAPEPSQMRRGRPKMTQEAKQAKKKAEAQQRQENAIETETAELADFDRRCKQFVEGIEPIVDPIGGMEVWSKLGGGAKTITAEVGRKEKLNTTRAEAVRRKIQVLTEWFKGTQDPSEDQIAETLGQLQARATPKFLSRGGDARRGDQTVVEIFEYLIPHSVYLLKSALRGRFLLGYKHSWQEMLLLTNIATNLCKIAVEWLPRPSTLQSGIRKQVRNNIRPSLDDITEAIQIHLVLLEQKERNRKRAEDLEKAQAESRAKRQRQWDQMQARMYSRRGSPAPFTGTTGAGRNQDEVVDIDDVEDDVSMHRVNTSKSDARPRPHLPRQATEEIPAPDPMDSWTEEEEIALLNGLQRFSEADRYARVLKTCSQQLARKNVKQCVARARYYKQSCGEMLAEKAAKGDHSSSWLASV